MREGLPLPSCLQGSLGSHQVEQLHLITATGRQLDEEPLKDALGLIAKRRAQQAQAGCRFLTQLPQQLTAAPRKHQGGKKHKDNRSNVRHAKTNQIRKMSGSRYKHKSGTTKRKEKGSKKTKLAKPDSYFVRPNPIPLKDKPDSVYTDSYMILTLSKLPTMLPASWLVLPSVP